ncbi:MAG: hypothetical protein COV44_12120 [Deltaproteobacteria bacterium CG11_big_fil_rev_8_21_14_0_20_45_16]|nr:MAG: hypothetical protein COV44_12120 [Deltaproteobacteria bacterium CG11_big_fil_rev_8_21_14_0_20_45_16]
MAKKKIFRAQGLVSSNTAHDVFESDAFLAIEASKIVGLGSWKDRPRHKSFQIEDCRYGVITPGLYNLHTHLAMTLFRGLAEDLDLFSWLRDYIFPAEKKWVDPNFVRVGTELGACELIRSGCVGVADMYYFVEAQAGALDRSGLRGVIGQHFFDEGGTDSKSQDDALRKAKALKRKLKKHPRLQAALIAHAPYTCSQRTLEFVAQSAKELDMGIMMHTSETKKELADIKRQTGSSPVQLAKRSGLLEAKFALLAHCVWLEDQDYNYLRQSNVTAVFNPQCNAKLGSGIPPIQKMLASNARFCVGTDGPASNNNLDMFAEINFLSKIHHVSQGDLKSLPGQIVFDSVTRRSAEAIGLGAQCGSLEEGKEADFIVIDTRSPHMQPLHRIYSHLIYSVQGPDVESVYVGGKALMKRRRILSLNEPRILREAAAWGQKIRSALPSQQQPDQLASRA